MGTPTQHINAPLTGPAYMAPGEMPAAPPAAVTKSLAPSGLRTSLMLVGFVLILLIAVAAVGVVKIFTSRASRPEPPTATVPEAPPPPPAPPPTGRDSSATTSPLVYPGAEIILDISKGENRVLQLRTTDPLDKVVAWYVEKLKPTSNTKVPGENLTVLQGNGVKAVITNTGAQTEIIIKQGADE
jgi:hypothetical protein